MRNAIDELLEAVNGKAVEPMWQTAEKPPTLDFKVGGEMYAILDSRMWLAPGPLDSLHFDRVGILQHWPEPIANSPSVKKSKPTGPRPVKRERVAADMQAAIAEGKITREKLKDEKEEVLASQYKVNRETARNARAKVLSEIAKSETPTKPDN
jgi:hypothetical protein